jgi:SHAQKYF class myb-like DNA-binding protein
MADLSNSANTQSTQEAAALSVPAALVPTVAPSNTTVLVSATVAVPASPACAVPAVLGKGNENSIIADPVSNVGKAEEENPLITVSAPETEIAPSTATPPLTTSSPTKPKSKKKKSSSHGASASQSGDGENTGRWTAEEHRLFLQGLEQHGKGWKKIASLIKSRTVVQIRTHAQKYFQKLSKARQNGEEGDVTMEGRGCAASVTSTASNIVVQTQKRRRHVTGTKRKTIQSVVASAQRQGKKIMTHDKKNGNTGQLPSLPSVAPALAHFLIPPLSERSNNDDIITGQGLEDAL